MKNQENPRRALPPGRRSSTNALWGGVRESTRVLLVDGDEGSRTTVAGAIVSEGVEVVASVATGREALAKLFAAAPHVALIELELVDMPGDALIRSLRARAPALAVVVLTAAEGPEAILRAIEAGASGYLLKETPLAELERAIAQVRDGQAPLSPRVASQLVAAIRQRGSAPCPFSLTAREHEILRLLVRGHTYASCAEALGLRVGTVQTHVKNLYRKLEVCSKAEAAIVAVRYGLAEQE